MELTIPVYVEVRKREGRAVHHVRPLFFASTPAEIQSSGLFRRPTAPVQASDSQLALAIGKLLKRMKEFLDGLGQQARHERLADCAFSPPLETHVLKLQFDLPGKGPARCRLLFVTFPALGRRIAFSPTLPELWFEIVEEETLEQRAQFVLSQFFRDQAREARRGRQALTPDECSLPGQAWITTVDVDVRTAAADPKKVERQLAALFDDSKLDGAVELSRVGRCLDWLYPDELHRAIGREGEAGQLFELLAGSDARPIVLVGPRLVGKTAIVHECVRRRIAQRGKPYAARQNVWLLSPQRLISGMMYVGQWEGRLNAILKTARRRKHVLYFDDFLGLYRAGVTSDASHSVADVLRGFIQRRDVRVLAEMTAEAWQAFQERDRGLADQFHVLRIAPFSEEQTLRAMFEVQRRLESEHRTSFSLDALPAIVQLQRSYIRDAAFPGKAAAFAQRVAQKQTRKNVGRGEVFSEFHRQTGLALPLIDDRQRLARSDVVRRLRERIVGQDAAIETAADIVGIAKARLADPERPLATLLFLGPTGVGKTECAKALAEVMFTDANKLLRFDMNEFGSAQAAARLAGSLGDPEGLLTAAVRRQPFAVVLLDEIEKAHPDVFDLLLQVTGEGRLTDALGRTTDFTGTVIVMTSNLGTAESGRRIGLAVDEASRERSRELAFVRAAESFFRPEFFNRIDRLVPFESLSRDEMRKVAEMQLESIFRRDGLIRRRCSLCVEPAAMERIVDAGYHPRFGARALKRALEKELVQPIAASLAGAKPELPAIIAVYPAGDFANRSTSSGVTARIHPLESAPLATSPFFDDLPSETRMERIERYLDRVASDLEASRPQASSAGASSGGVSPAQVRYYAIKEEWRRARDLHRQLAEALANQGRMPARSAVAPRSVSAGKRLAGIQRSHRHVSARGVLRELHAASDIHDYLREAAESMPRIDDVEGQLVGLRRQAAMLAAMSDSTSASSPQLERLSIVFHPLSAAAAPFAWRLLYWLQPTLTELGFACDDLTGQRGRPPCLAVAGPGVWPLVSQEAGIHLLCRKHENLLPVQAIVAPHTTDSDPVKTFVDARAEWRARVARGEAAFADDPYPFGRAVRFYDEGGGALDVRSGRSTGAFPTIAEGREFLLDGLPLPAQLEEAP